MHYAGRSERERDRDRETERQTDRQTETETETDRQTDRESELILLDIRSQLFDHLIDLCFP